MTNNLTMTSAVYDTSAQKFGSAALSGGRGVAGSQLGLTATSFTIEGWFTAPSGTGGTKVALSMSANVWLGAQDGKVAAGLSTNAQTVGSATIVDGAKHHVALVGDTSAARIYVDGVLISTASAIAASAFSNSANFIIGAYDASGNYGWTGILDEVAVFNTARYTGSSYTVPTSAYTGNESGLVGLYHLDGNGSDSTGTSAGSGTSSSSSSIAIAPNNAAIIYSPANWTGATATSNATVNAGAYFKTLINGACTLNFATAGMTAPLSQVSYRVDGGAWTDGAVSSTIAVGIPSALAAAPWQMLEVVVKSTSETIDRWNGSPPATAVVFTGLTSTSSSFAVSAPVKLTRSILVFGDSITEGVRTINETATLDTDRNDARTGWAFMLGQLLGVEVGVIGFGSQGWAKTGSGNVPALPSSFNLCYTGAARTWPSDLVAVFVNMGTNDSSATDATVTSAVQSFLTGILSATATPAPSIVMLRPFNGSKASAIQAGITAVASGRVFYEDSTGIFDTSYGADGLALHPNGPNNIARIAPALVNKLRQYAQPRRFTLMAA